MPGRQLLRDIRLVLKHRELRPVYEVDTDQRTVPNRPDRLSDFGVVSGRDNLGQAILMRLLTPRGELSALAHPEYGSRLHELIGSRNVATSQNLAKLFILESLKLEPRIRKVVSLTVQPAPVAGEKRDVSVERVSLLISLAVQPVDDAAVLQVGPFTLELAP
jgi:phage baseplate assembly protein W